MSRIWKWILGIALGLVILVGLGFVAANYFGLDHMAIWGRPAAYNRPMMENYAFDHRGPMDGLRSFRRPLLGRRGPGGFGFMTLPFFFVGGLLRMVFPLALLALVAYFSYRAGKQAGIKAVQVAPAPEPKPETSE